MAVLRGLLRRRLYSRARAEMRHHQLADHPVLLDDPVFRGRERRYLYRLMLKGETPV